MRRLGNRERCGLGSGRDGGRMQAIVHCTLARYPLLVSGASDSHAATAASASASEASKSPRRWEHRLRLQSSEVATGLSLSAFE